MDINLLIFGIKEKTRYVSSKLYNNYITKKNIIIRCSICGRLETSAINDIGKHADLFYKMRNPYTKEKIYICPGCTEGHLYAKYEDYDYIEDLNNEINYSIKRIKESNKKIKVV